MILSTFTSFSFIFKKSLCTAIAINCVLLPALLMFIGQCLGRSACPSVVPAGWESRVSEHGRPYKHLCSPSSVATLVALFEWNWQSGVSLSSSIVPIPAGKGKKGIIRD